MSTGVKLLFIAVGFFIFGLISVHTSLVPGGAATVPRYFEQLAMQELQADGQDWARVEISGLRAVVTGQASSELERQRALDILRRQQGGFVAWRPAITEVVDDVEIIPVMAPYRLTAVTDDQGKWSIRGAVPSRAARQTLLDNLEALRPRSEELTAELEIAAGEPENGNWLDAVNHGLTVLDRLRSGKVEIIDTRILVSGIAPTAESRNLIMQFALNAPDGFTTAVNVSSLGRETVRVPEDDCQSRVQRIARSERIDFTFDSADLSPDSAEALNAVVRLIRRCNPPLVRVEGHTDAIGDPLYNLELSQRRADSVREFFLAAGLASDRVIAEGFGASQPIGDNATLEGRRANRRIDFVFVDSSPSSSEAAP